MDYNSEVNFSDLDVQNLHLKNKDKAQIAFEISSADLGHLLLGDSDHYALLVDKFGETHLYTILLAQLENLVPSVTHQIDAQIFYTKYART